MDLTHAERDGVLVLAASGDINAVVADRFEAEIVRCLEGGGNRLVLDMGEVRYVSSAGLRVLLLVAKRIGREGAFVLARPAEAVQSVLKMMGFMAILRVEPTLDAAVAAAKGG